jgi:hypothetical protein
MQVYGTVNIQLHTCLTSELDRTEHSPLYSGCFIPSTRWIGDWVDLRANLDMVAEAKIPVPTQ